jgi:hypothetical protein
LRCTARIAASCLVALVALLAITVSAGAAPKPITGKLNARGYTVIALAETGVASTVRVTRGDGGFRLRPPALRVTLQLRAPNGTYAGPIVLAERKRARNEVRRAEREVRQAKRNVRRARRTGKGLKKARGQLRKASRRLKSARRLLRRTRNSAIVGVKAGARLGGVRVRRGYAKLSKPLRKRWVDQSRFARARGEVPIGAGSFGRVRSTRVRRAAPGDSDLDGIPDRLDIDDDGDLILDDADLTSAAGAAQLAPSFGVLSQLGLPPSATVNANPRHRADPTRPAFTDAEIDNALKAYGGLIFGLEGGLSPALSELDCGGDPTADPPAPALSYCTPGGTGKAPPPGAPRPTGACRDATEPYPGSPGGPFDPDRDGLGSFLPFDGCASMLHGATSAEIKTGDLLIQRGRDSRGADVAFTTTLRYVFATAPALFSYRDTTMAAPAPVPYPHDPADGPSLLVGAPPGADVRVTLTFWRPQRRRIANDRPAGPGESATWTDSGGRDYGIGTSPVGAGPCPQSAFSDPGSEPVPNLLTLPPPGPPGSQGPVVGGGGFRDLALDQPANPNNKLTFTLNISECLRAGGKASAFDQSGETVLLELKAVSRGGGSAQQTLSFERK